MKVLGIIFCAIFLLSFILAKIKINGSADITIMQRLLACVAVGIILTLILGLPVLGIMYLLGI